MRQTTERIAALLRANKGVAFCRECLATSVGLAGDATSPAFAALTQSWEFQEEYRLCFRCRKATAVFRALPRQYNP